MIEKLFTIWALFSLIPQLAWIEELGNSTTAAELGNSTAGAPLAYWIRRQTPNLKIAGSSPQTALQDAMDAMQGTMTICPTVGLP